MKLSIAVLLSWCALAGMAEAGPPLWTRCPQGWDHEWRIVMTNDDGSPRRVAFDRWGPGVLAWVSDGTTGIVPEDVSVQVLGFWPEEIPWPIGMPGRPASQEMLWVQINKASPGWGVYWLQICWPL